MLLSVGHDVGSVNGGEDIDEVEMAEVESLGLGHLDAGVNGGQEP